MPYAQTDRSDGEQYLANPAPDVKTREKLEGGRAFKMVTQFEAAGDQPRLLVAAIFLVAAILPVGAAMQRTGAAELLAGSVAGIAGDAGPYAVLLALMVLSSLLSQGLDGAPTVVLLGPDVISTASQVGLSPYPLKY